MSEPETFSGFFSYSHHDAETDPGLVEAFTKHLEGRVNGKLVNARFRIWRDKEELRTGNKWNEKIEAQLRASDVMIVLLTPRWIDSEYCRKEYIIFEQAESEREVGEYIAPILAGTIEEQEKHFTAGQRDVYERIKSRQYLKAIAVEFQQLTKPKRNLLISRLADDVLGMVERRRTAPPKPPNKRAVRPRKTREFDPVAHNYELVDFVRDSEIVLDRQNAGGERGERLSRSTIPDRESWQRSTT
jgi:hypothetical protein